MDDNDVETEDAGFDRFILARRAAETILPSRFSRLSSNRFSRLSSRSRFSSLSRKLGSFNRSGKVVPKPGFGVSRNEELCLELQKKKLDFFDDIRADSEKAWENGKKVADCNTRKPSGGHQGTDKCVPSTSSVPMIGRSHRTEQKYGEQYLRANVQVFVSLSHFSMQRFLLLFCFFLFV